MEYIDGPILVMDSPGVNYTLIGYVVHNSFKTLLKTVLISLLCGAYELSN
jgi:hypothetical protein